MTRTSSTITAQINLVDVLKRIRGISDINVFGRKYAMRIWLDPDRLANEQISPDEVIDAIKSENRQAAAGKIGAPPVPAGQRFEYPVTAKGRLSTVPEFEEIIVRAKPDGSKVFLKDVARVELGSETYEQAGYLSGKAAATIPIYQYSNANALAIVEQVKHEMDRLARNFPPDVEYRIAFDTTRYVEENINEVEHTLVEAFALVLIVVFVFLQGLRTTLIPMVAIPVVAGRHVRPDGGVRVLDQHAHADGAGAGDRPGRGRRDHRGRERREVPRARLQPLEATRAAMAEITTPIVTITLVLAAVFVPVAFIPGLTGRLYNQFALTIVFSFLFSAVNSLTFSPAMARLFLKAKTHHGESKFFFFRWFNRGMKWLENSYDSFLEYTAHHWWTDRHPLARPAGARRRWMLVERPKSFIPVEDQGYLIVTVQTPDGTTQEPTSRVMDRVEQIALKMEGVADTIRFDGLNPLTQVNQSNSGAIYVVLKHWEERKSAELRARALVARLQQELSRRGHRRPGPGLPAPADPGPGDHRRVRVPDRGSRGPRRAGAGRRRRPVHGRGRANGPSCPDSSRPFSVRVPQLRFELDRGKARNLDVPVSTVFETLQVYLGGYYVNDFNRFGKTWRVYVQSEGEPRRDPNDILATQGPEQPRRARAALGARGCQDGSSARSTCRTTTSTTPPRSRATPPRATARGRPSRPCRRSPPRRSPTGSATNGPARPTRS